MKQPSILIWGAGRIGRGFAADLFHSAGYHLIFVDQAEGLVSALRQAGQYTVVRAPGAGQRTDHSIAHFEAFSTRETADIQAALTRVDTLAVCVFPKDFAAAVPQLAQGLLARSRANPNPLDILLFTNLAHAGPQFTEALARELPPEILARTGVVESLVIRMVTEPPAAEAGRDPLLVWTNGYAELPVDRAAFKAALPAVPGLRPVEDMRAEETRKLFTYNAFHAALAYFGARRGIERSIDCLADPQVRAAAGAVLAETSQALQAEFGFTPEEMEHWNRGVLEQTNNPALGDTVARYGADPRRKLARADRLTGPLLLAARHALPHGAIARAIAAGLLFAPPGDEGGAEIQARIESAGLRAAVVQTCGLLPAEADLVDAVVSAYLAQLSPPEWAGLAGRAYRLGFDYEQTYHGCGQCTIAALGDTLGQATGPVFAAATGFSGGLGLSGDAPCGALMGATLVFGLFFARRREHITGDREGKYRNFAMVQKLRQRTLDTYGGIHCHQVHRKILGRPFDLQDPAERAAFEAAGAHDDKCTGVVARACQWAVEILAEEIAAASKPQHPINQEGH